MELKNFYKLMSPRLTTLVSTIDESGEKNVAPFSFVSPVSFNPPLLVFSCGKDKKTYYNVLGTKEFVVSVPSKDMLDIIWKAGKTRYSKSKIEKVGIKLKKSKIVKPYSIENCPANIECFLEWEKNAGDHMIMVGRVVNVDVDDKLVDENGYIKTMKAQTPLHIGGPTFAFVGKEEKIKE